MPIVSIFLQLQDIEIEARSNKTFQDLSWLILVMIYSNKGSDSFLCEMQEAKNNANSCWNKSNTVYV